MASQEQQYDHLFKFLLVGSSGVGKSSLMLQFTDGVFEESVPSTIGVDFKVKMMRVNGTTIKASIWDSAGQERFRTLTSSYYRGAHAAILVFDCTRMVTFEDLSHWLKEVEMYSTNADVVKLLVCNKVDLADRRVVTRDMALEFARTHGMLYIETSAKTKIGVQQAFEEVAQKILDTESLVQNTAPVKLRLHDQQQAAQGGYCGGYCL